VNLSNFITFFVGRTILPIFNIKQEKILYKTNRIIFYLNGEMQEWFGSAIPLGELARLESVCIFTGTVGSEPEAHQPPAENPTPLLNVLNNENVLCVCSL
jgi:hypothetical protein